MYNNIIMLHTPFQKNISISNDLKFEIENLKLEFGKTITKLKDDLEISLIKNEAVNEKVKILKDDLEISLKNNDINNLEIRKLQLYNFMFKVIGGISLAINFYYIKKNL